MGTYSTPADLKVEYDDAGGTLRDISQYVQTINGITIDQIIEELSGFGENSERKLPIGKSRLTDIELGLVFRTGANSPHELFHRASPETPDSTTRTLKITYQAGSGGLYESVETYRGAYTKSPDKNALMKASVTLVQNGAVTTATNP